ncbi:unnamed protein product [Rotaria magnacalcarata]|uniref:Tectonic-1 n=2 Tax=Rotaria magnacalcarata TaxID=392030 RepID=A0A819J0V6_9BILA|nr:unnamed protein product [Rotaria magnacalcarata]
MVEEALSNFRLFIDDENKIRLIDPERVTDSAELRDECKDFTDNVLEFKKIVDTLIEKTEQYSKQVEAARLKAMGAKNMLKSAAKYRDFEKQQLQSLIKEKMVELERLRTEYESLQKTEREQNEKMEQLSLKAFIFALLITTTTVYCQSVSVTFPTFPANTDLGPCTCDITANKCDASCCCDPDCSPGDQQAFLCSTKANQYTNVTPIISSVQPSCYKNISIFKSNSPYIIQKMGELVCIDFQRFIGSQYYQQPNIKSLDPGLFIRTLDTEESVVAPASLQTTSSVYKVGSSILSYSTVRSALSYYTLPVKLFNNPLCSGSQTITYMNDFTSTCIQLVSNSTCTNALNPMTYLSPLCLIQSPSQSSSAAGRICDNTTFVASSFTGSTCTGALQSLTVRIFYSNPTGIVSLNVSAATLGASTTTSYKQTFTIQFIENTPSPAPSSAIRSPGYLQGSPIAIVTVNSSKINAMSSSQFSILEPLSDGSCNVNSTRIPIVFGENFRSTCTYRTTTSGTCPTNLYTLLMPVTLRSLYVAAYNYSDPTNITTDWLPVVSCTSQIGSPNTVQCQNGILLSGDSPTQCYVKLDIQIAYTNIGSFNNPQPTLSAVIFHYQSVSSSSLTSSSFLVMESVSFQDISGATAIIGGRIPAPDTSLPADFFYPFSASQATKSMAKLLFSSVLISILFILM